MFLDYISFLNESFERFLERASELAASKELAEKLAECSEGKYPNVQIVDTPGADSYVGVAINDGASFSEVYKVSDPRVALVAIVMKNTGKDDTKSIIDEITSEDHSILRYSVFGGNKVMDPKEIAARFNLDIYKVPNGDTVSYCTSTPIRKTF